MADRTRLDHETILRVVGMWQPEAQRALAWEILRYVGAPPGEEPLARPAATGCQAPGPAAASTEERARWPDAPWAHSGRPLTDTLPLRSVGNQHISFSATVPLPRKEKPPKPPRRPRPMPMDAMRANVREFLTLYATTGPTKWNYARWPGRIVSVSTIEKRFGSWSQAVAQARHPDCLQHPEGSDRLAQPAGCEHCDSA